MTVVVKIGGARAVDPQGALSDAAQLVATERLAIVHGGSTAVDNTLERLGIEPEYVETPSGVVGRFTDAETMDVFKMAMAGRVNTDLVAGLQNAGVDAVGLSGVDGRLFHGPRKEAVRVLEDGKKKIRRGDHSGTIRDVNGDLLERLLDGGYTPVTSPPMLADNGGGETNTVAGESEPRYVAVNTDADRAAGAVAAELGAILVSLTDVAGVYRDPEIESTLIERVETPEALTDLEAAAEGFMGRKVMAAIEALDGGATEVVIASANAEDPIQSAIEGGGTHILPSALEDD